MVLGAVTVLLPQEEIVKARAVIKVEKVKECLRIRMTVRAMALNTSAWNLEAPAVVFIKLPS